MHLVHAAYEPEGGGPHPTIVALHGWGASALDLLGLAPMLGRGRCLVLCPQGPVRVPLGAAAGFGWFPIIVGAPPDPQEIESALDLLRGFVGEALRRYAVDPRKLILLGFSQGGVMAYMLGLAEPERFAGLIALSSWLPNALVHQLPATQRQHLPILVQHGTDDPMIEVGRARESVESLRRLGVSLTYREYPMGHEISLDSLRDLSQWLDEKVLQPIALA